MIHPIRALIFISPLALSLLLGACQNYRTPRLSATPASMSSDTLCYRYATTKNEALGKEITARGLNCAAILENDPLYQRR